MKLTDLQVRILGKMHLKPRTGYDIMVALGYTGSHRAFAAALIRMRDRGLIDVGGEIGHITYEPTPKGLGLFLDAQAGDSERVTSE